MIIHDPLKVLPPKTWKEFKILKNILPYCSGEITRFPKDKEFYESHTHSLTQEEKLNEIYKLMGNNKIYFLINKFPYTRILQNLPNVKHYCLWSRIGILSPKKIDQEIQKKFSKKDYFWFENTSQIKSIPEIWHCHVFIKFDNLIEGKLINTSLKGDINV